MWVMPVVSVMPYPSRMGIPMLWEKLQDLMGNGGGAGNA